MENALEKGRPPPGGGWRGSPSGPALGGGRAGPVSGESFQQPTCPGKGAAEPITRIAPAQRETTVSCPMLSGPVEEKSPVLSDRPRMDDPRARPEAVEPFLADHSPTAW
ncbi:hypothetical protein Ppa06_51170 [Planomonospora parontospora subsp. parontospora]|uniref:Uncharacterized protein n=2 Tax=Planomonospora parontospora TaxID=58119 RepID=A0AA37BJJ6_9ACTN|nr:hypothetical protein GCM10010126_44560 [Planomonospora parontospora]GII11319.1 hypothetical protein Ppa06_51170 [Planomonospora parontospora subsp. parontospora]